MLKSMSNNTATKRVVSGTTQDDRLYVLVSLDSDDLDALQRIDAKVLEVFLKVNVLVNFGAVGYTEFPVSVIHKNADHPQFVVEISNRNLSELMLIAANRFPVKLHISLAELVKASKDVSLRIVKYDTNLWNVNI